eukprot:1730460-Prorocentrum_lima.AAC.1
MASISALGYSCHGPLGYFCKGALGYLIPCFRLCAVGSSGRAAVKQTKRGDRDPCHGAGSEPAARP